MLLFADTATPTMDQSSPFEGLRGRNLHTNAEKIVVFPHVETSSWVRHSSDVETPQRPFLPVVARPEFVICQGSASRESRRPSQEE